MPELLLLPHLGAGGAGGRGSAGITKRREAGFHLCGVLRSLSISPGCVVRLSHRRPGQFTFAGLPLGSRCWD